MTPSSLKNSLPSFPFQWHHGLWVVILLVLGACAFLFTPFPPMADWPQHVSLGTLLARFGNPTPLLQDTYCLQPFQPQHLFHHMVKWLYVGLGPVWVSRVALLVVYLLYATSLLVLLRTFRAEMRLVGAGIPLFFGFLYQMGFAPNMLGVSFFFFCIALAERWKQQPHWTRGLALFLGLLCTWLIHPLPYYTVLGIIGIYLCITLWGQWSLLIRAAGWLGAPAVLALFHLNQIQAYNADMLPPSVGEPSVGQKLIEVPSLLFGLSQQRTFEIVLALLWLLGLIFLIVQGQRQEKAAGRRTQFGGTLAMFGALLLGFLLAKNFMLRGVYVYQRFLWLACVVGFLLIPPVQHKWSRTVLWGMMVVSLLFLAFNVHLHIEWSRSIRGIYGLMAKIPKDTHHMTLVPPIRNRLTRRLLRRHLGLEVQIYRGGVHRPTFTHIPRMPIADCKPKVQQDLLHLNITKLPWRFHPRRHRHHARYLMIYLLPSPQASHMIYPWLFVKKPIYQLVAQNGPWALLKRIEQRKQRPEK